MSIKQKNNAYLRLNIFEKKILILFCDFVMVFVALFLVIILRRAITMDIFLNRNYLLAIFLYTNVSIIIFYIVDLYNIFDLDFWTSILPRTFFGILLTVLLIIVISFFAEVLALPRISIIVLFFTLFFGMAVTRYYLIVVNRYQINVSIVGTGFSTLKFIEDFTKKKNTLFNIVGIYGEEGSLKNMSIMNSKIRGGVKNFMDDLETFSPQMVVVSFESTLKDKWTDALLHCARNNIKVCSVQDVYGKLFGKVPSDHIDALWLISGMGLDDKPYLLLKGAVDIFFGVIGLILMCFWYPFIFVAIKLFSPGPVFFSQTRVGLNGKHFKIHKFRTMIINAETETGAVWCQKKDSRVTFIGRLMRKLRIDELPQFYNILKGDMSLIGPRPERPEFVDLLKQRIPFYDERHLVKPGLTGWAQVLFPYGSSIEDAAEKLHYDLFYIKNMSVFMDIKIFLKTFATVLAGKGGM